ncbi:hypothetical protein FX983_00341 [Pseudomonas frederiksbergensis]|uniref:Uncharacterized protein n=1 Tax=Pseudomonas frederiksbergensis TaxID=104087 RepID=A0A6L5BVP0_9PSED|nr:hypothetical protein FX983_00341 [Pseudomonas frederiksbergensis]
MIFSRFLNMTQRRIPHFHADGMKWKIPEFFLKIFIDWQLSSGEKTFKRQVLRINPLG